MRQDGSVPYTQHCTDRSSPVITEWNGTFFFPLEYRDVKVKDKKGRNFAVIHSIFPSGIPALYFSFARVSNTAIGSDSDQGWVSASWSIVGAVGLAGTWEAVGTGWQAGSGEAGMLSAGGSHPGSSSAKPGSIGAGRLPPAGHKQFHSSFSELPDPIPVDGRVAGMTKL